MNWIDIKSNIKPSIGRVVICYCPDWCSKEYQIAHWDGKNFCYEEQPNDMFNGYVKSWALFMEAD